MKIAIFGAAGAVGRTTLPELLRRGHEVRLVGRTAAKLTPLARQGVDIVVADVADATQARRAAEGVDAVLYAVGLPYHHSAQYPSLARTAVEAARSAHVGRFVLISTVYPYGRARTATVTESHPREPHTEKGRNRKAQADIVTAADDAAGMRTTVLTLPDFYGPEADLSYAKEIFTAALARKTATVVGPLDVPHEFVYLPDAAPVIADLLTRPDALPGTFHLAGAGTITMHEFVRLAERAAGTRVRVLAVNKTMLRLMGTVSPLMREIADMYYLFTDPVVLDDARLRGVLDVAPKTPYAEGIAQTLAVLRGRTASLHA